MADYECFPLWGQSDDLPINIDPQTLPLTSETVQELLNWADLYDGTLNREDPEESGFRTASEAEEFETKGIQLWQTLSDELGPEYEVSYFSKNDSIKSS